MNAPVLAGRLCLHSSEMGTYKRFCSSMDQIFSMKLLPHSRTIGLKDLRKPSSDQNIFSMRRRSTTCNDQAAPGLPNLPFPASASRVQLPYPLTAPHQSLPILRVLFVVVDLWVPARMKLLAFAHTSLPRYQIVRIPIRSPSASIKYT